MTSIRCSGAVSVMNKLSTVLLAFFLASSEAFITFLETANASFDPAYMTIETSVTQGSADLTNYGIHMSNTVLQELPNFKARVQFWIYPLGMRNDEKKRMKFFDSGNMDLCTLLLEGREKKLNMLYQHFFDRLNSYGPLPAACPIPKGTYTFNNVTVNGRKLPIFDQLPGSADTVILTDLKMDVDGKEKRLGQIGFYGGFKPN